MPTTRQKILEYLKRNRSASARELAQVLGVTAANARHHLDILAEDGRVQVVAKRQIGRGRPEKLYALSGTLVGDNLSELADLLLTEAGTEVAMEALAERMTGKDQFPELPLMRRLAKSMDFLNARHYLARWEAGARGPQVILGQCPYAAIIEAHPELCRMDTTLLAEMLGTEVHQTAKLEPGTGGMTYCSFAVQEE